MTESTTYSLSPGDDRAPVPDPIVEVRRLLHTNYNCTNVERLEQFYVNTFAMKNVMRSVSNHTAGVLFGLEMDTSTDTIFLYDHRGPRAITSLELAQWNDPPTCGSPYPHPWHHGIQALGFTVPNLDDVRGAAEAHGGKVVAQQGDALVIHDPEALPIEVFQTDNPQVEQRHVRIVVHDMADTISWWSKLGYVAVSPEPYVLLDNLRKGDTEHSTDETVAMVATDEQSFALIFETWNGPPPIGPPYTPPFHQGLYRMAMAVDDVQAAWQALSAAGMAIYPPYTFPLPGTKITKGLTILFLRDPNGIVVELVERPRSIFEVSVGASTDL